MPHSDRSGKPAFVHRRYLLDRPAQLEFTRAILLIVCGIGLLYAVALYFLADSDLLRNREPNDVRQVLLVVHTAYFLVCGTMLYATVLLLSHRFAGPGYVLRQAVEKMRRGDYTGRLNLRKRDFHKDLAEELEKLQGEMAARDEARLDALARLQGCLDDGDVAEARKLAAELVVGHAAGRATPLPGAGTRAVA